MPDVEAGLDELAGFDEELELGSSDEEDSSCEELGGSDEDTGCEDGSVDETGSVVGISLLLQPASGNIAVISNAATIKKHVHKEKRFIQVPPFRNEDKAYLSVY